MTEEEKIEARKEVMDILDLIATNEQKAEIIVNLLSTNRYKGKTQGMNEVRKEIRS